MIFPMLVFMVMIMWSCDNGLPEVSIVMSDTDSHVVKHGHKQLISSLAKQHISHETVNDLSEARGKHLLIAGLTSSTGTAAQLLKDNEQQIPKVAEALTIWQTVADDKPAWVINGFDDRGLMYGLLDLADRVSWSTDQQAPFSEVEAITEQPDVTTRAISMYTMNRAYWESRFYDEQYWSRYMDVLAKNRFNSLVVIFGYENGGFLAPCYPYFFNVDGFPDVKMEGMTAEEQAANLAALNRMKDMAHQRGMDFKVAIWDHIYRGGVQTGGISKEDLEKQSKDHLVQGVTAENLSAYTRAAFEKFVRLVPNLDGIQLRMHNESGLKRGEEMKNFWSDMFGMIKTTVPELQINLRAKELPESIIEIARDIDLNFTVTTKYWMEQMGLPFHPTHINRQNQFDRRHGYADMLSYPRKYKVHWRLWSGGTQRVLLWGDPSYVRRFSASTHLYDGEGFEINEPLATKMEAQAHDVEPFQLLTAPYVYYDYEFERYWHFFQVFGRVAYNPEVTPMIWQKEFEQRFGLDTGPILQAALHKASKVLPMIMAACAPYGKFPTTRGWAAKQRFGDLPQYAISEGSDIQQFASFDTEAQLLIEGGTTPKRLPSTTSLWFEDAHKEIEQLINQAKDIDRDQGKEFYSTLTDLSILSNLALYHARRIPAAVSYRLYVRTKDPRALDEAINHESRAIEAWSNIVEAAGDVYARDLMMGVRSAGHGGITHRLTGHWKDELTYLEKGLEQLKLERNHRKENAVIHRAPSYTPATKVSYEDLLQVDHQPVRKVPANQSVAVKATISAPAGVKWVRLRYRSVNQHLDYQTLPMKRVANRDDYVAVVPAEHIDPHYDFMYFIEIMDQNGNGRIYPDLDVGTPYIVVELDR